MQLTERAPAAERLADCGARPTLAATTLPGSAPGEIRLRAPQLIRRVVRRRMQARIVVSGALAIAASASCAPHESSPGSRPDSSAHLVGQPTTAAALAGDSSSKRWCFPSSQASLGGLSLDSPEPQITALLGPPLRRDTTLGSD